MSVLRLSNHCFLLLICLTVGLQVFLPLSGVAQERTFHDITVVDIDGNIVPLSTYKGRVALVVNTASRCGYTPQLAGLQRLHEKYSPSGFVILGFPSNDFGGQDPGTNEEIKAFCSGNYDVSFPMFAKSVVKGREKSELYAFLTSTSMPFREVGWNFEKFLISRDGIVLARFPSRAEPESQTVIESIEAALKGEG
jgi:glutathione peroxidase